MSAPFVSGVVLAAGRSTRLAGERPKQLLPCGGEAMVRRVARTALASQLREVLVVVGYQAPAVRRALAGLDLVVVVNSDYAGGQSTSVRAGLRRVDPRARAAMFIPADQPLLSPRLIDRLIAAYGESPKPIAVATWKGRRGAPVVFDRSLFGELEGLAGDCGGRALLPRYADAIVAVAADHPRELTDVDTPEDYRRLAAEIGMEAAWGEGVACDSGATGCDSAELRSAPCPPKHHDG